MKLTPHFTLEEMTFSEAAARHGVDNSAPADIVANLRWLCEELLEPIRELLGRPLIITSGYRCAEANRLIGGAENSEHVDGRAADFRVGYMTPYEVCNRIYKEMEGREFPYNQLIHEFGSWTHISIPKHTIDPKFQVLTAKRVGAKTIYVPGIVPV